MRSARFFLVPMFALSLCHCMSKRQVSVESIQAMGAKQKDAVVVRSVDSVFKTRIDPLATLRVVLKDGGKSKGFAAWSARVSDEGLFARERVSLNEVTRASVTELSITDREALESVLPDGATLEVDRDVVTLETAEGLHPWLSEFISVLRTRCAGPSCSIARHGLFAVSGTWSFTVRDQERRIGFREAYDFGIDTFAGWRWSEIESVEVEFVSGPKTLAGVVGTAALAVALAPLAFVGGGGVPGMGKGSGHGSGHGSSGSSGGATLRIVSGGVSGGGGGSRKAETGVDPHLGARASQPESLFSTKAKVKSVVRGVAALDVSATSSGRLDRQATGIALSVRLADMIELGGGVRDGRNHPVSGFFRATTIYPLDARHRFAITLGGEIGGSRKGKTGRLSSGFRFSGDHWFAEVISVSASFVDSDGRASGWRTALGSSIGVVFP